MNNQLKSFAAVAALAALGTGAAPQARAASITQQVDIVQSTIWTADNVYLLNDVVYVISNSTLTIEAGTLIRGLPDSANLSTNNNPGALIIAKGSKLKALGTEEKPIIFTDANDDNVPGGAKTNPQYNSYSKLTGQWGGLVILGDTFIAVSPGGGPTNLTFQAEGINGKGTLGLYGGLDDDDDSGVLRYVSFRYGGFGLASNSEINGITLCGVGRETAVDHLDVYNTQDDGIEFFGGTVNTKYVAIWNCGDDSYDQDQGYRGKNQFIFAVQGDAGGTSVGSGISDKALELDGPEPDRSNNQPWGLCSTYNVTAVGKGLTGWDASSNVVATYLTKAQNTAVHMKANYGGQFYNSLFLDFGGGGVIIENRNPTNDCAARFAMDYSNFTWAVNTSFAPPAELYTVQTRGWQVELRNNTWWQFGELINPTATNQVAKVGGSVSGAGPSPDFFFEPDGTTTTSNTVAGSLPVRYLTRGTTAPAYAAAGRSFNVDRIDPRPNPAVVSPSALVPPADGFYTPVNYVGAFSPDHNWCDGWTTMAKVGLLTNIVPNVTAPAATILVTATNSVTVSVPTVNGVWYSVESSPDRKHWTEEDTWVGNGSPQDVIDPNALGSRYFYRAVVP